MFDTTTPEFSYLVGLLQSDGHHSGSTDAKGRIEIEMNERDGEVLHALQQHIPYYSSITRRSRTTNFGPNESIMLGFYNQEARQTLEAYGVPVGRKSYIVAPPTLPHIEPDYVRGVLDADGSVGFTGKAMPFVSVVLTSDAMAEYFTEVVRKVCGVERTLKRNTRDNVYNLLVGNLAAAKLAAWAYYSDDCLAIPRKREAARKVAAWTVPEGKEGRYGVVRRKWSPEEDAIALSLPTKEAAEKLGRTEKSVTIRAFRLRAATRP